MSSCLRFSNGLARPVKHRDAVFYDAGELIRYAEALRIDGDAAFDIAAIVAHRRRFPVA